MTGEMTFRTEPGDRLSLLRDTIAALPLDDLSVDGDTLDAARAVASGEFKDHQLISLATGLAKSCTSGVALARAILNAFAEDYSTCFARMQAREFPNVKA